MKVRADHVDGFVARPDPAVVACLVYGPDAGLAHERAAALARHVVDDPDDPFRVSVLDAGMLSGETGRVGDEMLAGSFGGGRRLVSLREAGDSAAGPVEAALDRVARSRADAFLVVLAGDLSPRSSLRRLFEGRDDCAALPCYPDDEEARGRFARRALADAGVEIEPAALPALAGLLGEDRLSNRREIEKLVLYAGPHGRVGEADILAAVGDTAAASVDLAVFAAADGDAAGLDRALERHWAEGGSAVGLIRAAQRHFQRLHRVVAATRAGAPYDTAVRRLRPPLFWKLQKPFRRQVAMWNEAQLEDVMARLVEAELTLKSTGTPDTAACARTLAAVAHMQRTRTSRQTA